MSGLTAADFLGDIFDFLQHIQIHFNKGSSVKCQFLKTLDGMIKVKLPTNVVMVFFFKDITKIRRIKKWDILVEKI